MAQKSSSYQRSFTHRITTSETSKPENPQLEIKNPLHKSIYVNALDLVLDPQFSYKGNIEVYNNNSLIFSSVDNSLKNFSLFTIPLTAELLENNSKIKIFIWNFKDSLNIGLTVNSTVGEENNFLGSGSKTLDKEIFNNVESTIIDIFPKKLYNQSIIDKSLYMAGYEKLTVLFSAPESNRVVVISSVFDKSIIIDNNLDTFSQLYQMDNVNYTRYTTTLIDFGSIAKRTVGSKWKLVKTGNLSATEYVETSTDNVNYIPADSDIPMRYAKVHLNVLFGAQGSERNSMRLNLYEIYDKNIFGGSAKISFLIRDASGDLIEHINSAKFGTITSGKNLKIDISSTIKDSGGKIGALLPQLHKDFIIRLQITKNITVGVRLILTK